MPSLKEFNNKIASMTNTVKVTKTMNMVSSAKFRKAKTAQESSALYSEQLTNVLQGLAAAAVDSPHPLLQTREVKKVLIVAFSSDKGLCGGFNNNLSKYLVQWYKENNSKYETIDFLATSKRTASTARQLGNCIDSHEGITANPRFESSKEIGEKVQQLYTDGAYDEVILLFNRFESALSQTPTMETLLPLKAQEQSDSSASAVDYIYEPDKVQLLNYLLPKAVNFRIYKSFLENAAGEHAARMTAMDNATSNGGKLIRETTILRNRARQAAITTELTEIVAGAESLK